MERYGQFQDGEVGQTVVFLASGLVVKVILEDADVRGIVSVWTRAINNFIFLGLKSGVPTPETRFSIISDLSVGQIQDEVGSDIFFSSRYRSEPLTQIRDRNFTVTQVCHVLPRYHVFPLVPLFAGVKLDSSHPLNSH